MATAAKQQTVRGSTASSATSPGTGKTKSSGISQSLNLGGTSVVGLSPHTKQSKVGSASLSGGPAAFLETEEDIATIAKQISDHAEAIYQTWKARGLAPTEILNCHTATNDAFGKALLTSSVSSSSLSPSGSTGSSKRSSLDSPAVVAEFLAHSPDMSNNNLEKLVNSFVNEDKARQQAARKNSGGNILTSGTIKDALRKFENTSSPAGYVKPNYLMRNSTSPPNTAASASVKSPGSNFQKSTSPQPNSVIGGKKASSTTPERGTSPGSTQLNKNVPDVLMDTISQTKQLPKDGIASKRSGSPASSPSTQSPSTQTTGGAGSGGNYIIGSSSPNSIGHSNNSSISNTNSSSSISLSSLSSATSLSSGVKKPQTPAKPASLINHTPSWPLKNRISVGGSGGGSSGSNVTNTSPISGGGSTIKNGVKNGDGGDPIKATIHKSIESCKNSADLLDEVSREEERLINALKTGIVLNNNDTSSKLPEVITSTLNDKTDHGKKNWNKPDVSTVTGKNLSTSTTSSSRGKVVSNSGITSGSSGLSSTTSIVAAAAAAATAAVAAKGSPSAVSASSPSWNDDGSKGPVSLADITSSGSGSAGGISTTSVINPNLQKDISTSSATTTTATASPLAPSSATAMSPAPAPTPNKIKIRPKNDAAVPHPEAKQNIRPFLTRGSVAERVLMFEKCPDVKAPLRTINREPPKISNKPFTKPAQQQTHTTLQRHIRSSSKNVYIPRFHFPHGKPLPTIAIETTLQRLVSAFDSFPNNQVAKEDFHHILKICGLPFYWRMPLIACAQHATSGLVDGYRFIDFWKQMSVYCHETASRFVYILSRGQRSRPYILHEDLACLVQDVVDTHPGLAFLKEASEFHSRYVHTVIARIFYSVNRTWSGKITVPELRRSNLLQVIQLLEEEEDINQIMAFFSYEHFYVIYCKFWELDRDHDLFIDQHDLARHNDHALSTRIIARIFSGCVTRGGKARIMGPTGPKMSYTDFVWFLLSEEDKTNPTAIEYWFRCMDLDGDGVISMYELEYFYEEQQERMESIGIETLPFEDCLCQMLDMIKPDKPGCITLTDLKRCRMTPIFFDTFFNLEKYLEHEQRDPFATQRDSDDGMSDWDRYAAQEYELLVAEEGGDTQGSYDEDEDYESNIDILESQLDDMSNIINEW